MISSRGKGKEKLDESSIRSGYKTWYNVGGNVARVGMSLILRRRGISRFTRGGGELRRRGDEPGNAILPRWREEGEGGGVERLRLSVKGR